jgi:hypothetical protein
MLSARSRAAAEAGGGRRQHDPLRGRLTLVHHLLNLLALLVQKYKYWRSSLLRRLGLVLSLLALLVQKYKYWRSSPRSAALLHIQVERITESGTTILALLVQNTNTDTWGAQERLGKKAVVEDRVGGTQFTCFTGTKVQILMQKALQCWRQR